VDRLSEQQQAMLKLTMVMFDLRVLVDKHRHHQACKTLLEGIAFGKCCRPQDNVLMLHIDYTLSQNLVAQVSKRTNSQPVMRVGGNSLYLATWSPSASIIVPAHEQNKSIPGSLTLGPGYFDAFKNYAGAQYIVDIPMSNKATDVDTSVAIAQSAWETVGSENILMLELGNEPNSYGNSYGASQYATQFESFSTAVAQGLNLSTSAPEFLVGSLANQPTSDWNA